MTTTPKARFQDSSQNISSHKKLIDSNEFERAVHFALLEYQTLLTATMPKDFAGCGANFLCLKGAQDIIQIMRGLAETTPKVNIVDRDNLNHQT